MEKTFGEFLKERRQAKNLTQKQLSKMLIISESAISKWEKNIAHPDITLLPKLSEILDVSEHELITASIDTNSREEKSQAKKWRRLTFTWFMFFNIAYILALIPCFICNLAIDKTLSWFWIVASALLLAFTFTNLPKIIKKHKLIILPASMYLALCLLLGVCCIYTKGNWFIIPALSVLLALIIIFVPIYIAKYEVFNKIKKYNDFVSLSIDFIMLNILLISIDIYTNTNGYTSAHWYITIALPIVTIIYLIINLLVSIRFIKINKLLKTSIILFIVNICLYLPPLFIKFNNANIQKEINQMNILKVNFNNWIAEKSLENNIHFVIAMTLLSLSIICLIFGLLRHIKQKTK